VHSSVEADSRYFFRPAGPHRNVVSSNPVTVASVTSVLTRVMTSPSAWAQRRRMPCTKPVEGRAPVRSAISIAARCTGTCWKTSR
jgi:hypothetical protein